MFQLTLIIRIPRNTTSITFSDSTIDVTVNSSSDRVDIIPKNSVILSKVVLFGMISTLPLELAIGTSMVLSDIVIIWYYKVSEISKSVEAFVLIVKLCT